jgi:hypothetical protein
MPATHCHNTGSRAIATEARFPFPANPSTAYPTRPENGSGDSVRFDKPSLKSGWQRVDQSTHSVKRTVDGLDRPPEAAPQPQEPLEVIARDASLHAAVTSSSHFVASFDLMAASTVDLPKSMEKCGGGSLADGWTRKTDGSGRTFFVHLQTGRIVDDASKCCATPRLPEATEGGTRRLHDAKRRRALWPLPPG